MLTTELFVAGALTAFESLASTLPARRETKALAQQLAAIEEIKAVPPEQRIKPLPRHRRQDELPLEVVLHASESLEDRFILRGFKQFAGRWKLEPDLENAFFAGKLCFLRMHARRDQVEDLAKFSFLRVVREMPRLRTTIPVLRGNLHRPRAAILPVEGAVDANLHVAVFDGGLPNNSQLKPWTTSFDAPGVGAADNDLLWHGETVTSALLFGSADGSEVERPFCHVDHYRVLDKDSEKDPFELYDVLSVSSPCSTRVPTSSHRSASDRPCLWTTRRSTPGRRSSTASWRKVAFLRPLRPATQVQKRPTPSCRNGVCRSRRTA